MSGGWIPVRTEDGSSTLRHPLHGEACHSLSGAWLQARERYVGPCRLRERAARGDRAVLRLLDIGTGLGLNLAAAFEALEGTGIRLEALTFERDPSVLEAALRLLAEDGGVEGALRAVQGEVLALLAGAASEGSTRAHELGSRGSIRLFLGDARREILRLPIRPLFDAVFLDPFSPGREPELWSEPFLREIALRMAPESRLSTYSCAFRVRRALVRAGLWVGQGPRVGKKAEGTLASPDGNLPPLSDRILRRLGRAPHPFGIPPRRPFERPTGDRAGPLD